MLNKILCVKVFLIFPEKQLLNNMKIELNYTYDELTTLLDGLNNALISLKRNYNALLFGTENGVPNQLLKLNLNKETMVYRYNAIKDLYDHLLTYEAG